MNPVGGDLELSRLRISPDFGNKIGTRKLITTIPIRKPRRTEWIRTHSDSAWRIPVWVLMEEQELFVVASDIADSIPGEVAAMELVPTINRQGVLFLWPLRLPSPDGRVNDWNESAREAAERAIPTWVRVASNMALKAYEIYEVLADIPEPPWPDLSFDAMVKIAVRGRVIDSLEHPIVRKLRGEL